MSNSKLRGVEQTFTESEMQSRMALYAAFEHMQTAMESMGKAFKLVFPHIPKLALPPGQVSKFGVVAQTADRAATMIMQMQVQCGIARVSPVKPEPVGDSATKPPEEVAKPENPPSEMPKPSLVLPE